MQSHSDRPAASVNPPRHRGRESPSVRETATLLSTSGLSIIGVSAAASFSSPLPLLSTAGGIGRTYDAQTWTSARHLPAPLLRAAPYNIGERGRGSDWGGCVPRTTHVRAVGRFGAPPPDRPSHYKRLAYAEPQRSTNLAS